MFIVDHQELVNEEILKNTWPQLKEDLIQNAVPTLSALSLAMHQVYIVFVTLFSVHYKEKAKQQTAKEKAFASAAKGTRSITSFFSKK